MSGTQPKFFWRGYYAGGWSSWIQASASDHSHAEFNTLSTAIGTKQATITGAATTVVDANLSSEKVMVTDSSGKIAASSSITTTELGYLDGTSGTVPSLAGTVGNNGTSKKFFIQDPATGTPTATNVGDLWFW